MWIELISFLLLCLAFGILKFLKEMKLSKVQEEIVDTALKFLEQHGKLKELEQKLSVEARREVRKKTAIMQKKEFKK